MPLDAYDYYAESELLKDVEVYTEGHSNFTVKHTPTVQKWSLVLSQYTICQLLWGEISWRSLHLHAKNYLCQKIIKVSWTILCSLPWATARCPGLYSSQSTWQSQSHGWRWTEISVYQSTPAMNHLTMKRNIEATNHLRAKRNTDSSLLRIGQCMAHFL